MIPNAQRNPRFFAILIATCGLNSGGPAFACFAPDAISAGAKGG